MEWIWRSVLSRYKKIIEIYLKPRVLQIDAVETLLKISQLTLFPFPDFLVRQLLNSIAEVSSWVFQIKPNISCLSKQIIFPFHFQVLALWAFNGAVLIHSRKITAQQVRSLHINQCWWSRDLPWDNTPWWLTPDDCPCQKIFRGVINLLASYLNKHCFIELLCSIMKLVHFRWNETYKPFPREDVSSLMQSRQLKPPLNCQHPCHIKELISIS